MKKFLEKNRTLLPLFFFISGIILSDYIENQWLAIVIMTPILGILSLSERSYSKAAILLPIGLLFISFYTFENDNIVKFTKKKVDVEGIIFKSLERTNRYTKIYLSVEKIITDDHTLPVKGKIILYSDKELYGLYKGYRIRVLNIKLDQFKVYKNPGNFDIQKYYHTKGIYLKGYLNNRTDIISFGESEFANTLLINIDKLRESFGIYIRNKIEFPSSEIFTALTTGDKKGIPPEIRENLSALGIAHLLAISGLHVGAIALIFYVLIDWLLKRSEYLLLKYNVPRLTAGLTILPVLIYMTVAGLATPVLRATIMTVIYLLSMILGRAHNRINTLGVAAFAILLLEPSAIWDLSFQLSFISVSGILFVHYLYPISFLSFKDKLLTTLKCTLGATIFTLPLIINSFGILSLVSIPANLFFIPIVEFIIVPLCLLSFLVFHIHTAISDIFISLNGYLISLLLEIVNLLSAINFSSLTISYMNKTSFILLYLIIIFASLVVIKKKMIFPLLALLILFVITLNYNKRTDHLEIMFPDAGTRICSLIKLPNGKTILINGNTGRHVQSEHIERSVINNFLLNTGISKINYLILLTDERNLMDGTMFILNKYNIDYIYSNGRKLSGNIWEKINKDGIKIVNLLTDAEPLLISNTKLYFYIMSTKDTHNKKIVIKIVYNDKLILIGNINSLEIEQIKTKNDKNHTIDIDAVYIPDTRNIQDITKLVEKVNPKFIITKEITDKSIMNRLFQKLSILEMNKIGLISLIINQKIKVNKAYRYP